MSALLRNACPLSAEYEHGIEWQDIFEGKSIVIDEQGVMYQWDSSKMDEYATIVGYTMISIDRKWEHYQRCLETYFMLDKPYEFSFK